MFKRVVFNLVCSLWFGYWDVILCEIVGIISDMIWVSEFVYM